jgi:hypothetical protein
MKRFPLAVALLLALSTVAFAQGTPQPGGGGGGKGIGVQGGQSPIGVGNSSVALTAGGYLYYTNAAFTAAHTYTLPTSATQGAGDLEILDKQQTITAANTLTIAAGGTDTLNGVTNGTVVLYAAGSGVRISNDGAGNYTVADLLSLPNLPSADIYVGNASGLPAAVAMSGDATISNTGAVTNNKVTGLTITSATAPTIASGGCTSPAVTNVNGTAAFEITIGTSCTGVSTIVLTFPAAVHGWSCKATDLTSNSTNAVDQSSSVSTTSVTLTSYSRTAGTALAWTASDVVVGQCTPF